MLRAAFKRQTNEKPQKVLEGKGNVMMVRIRVYFTDLQRILLVLK